MSIFQAAFNVDLSHLHFYFLHLNAFVCSLIAIQLINYDRDGAKFKRSASIAAYCLVVAFGSVPIRVFFGEYARVDISEMVINLFLLGIVIRAKGNVMHLFRSKQDDIKPSIK